MPMEISYEKTACIGFGYATQADAFQSGREASQMAKSELPEGSVDLAVAIGPANIQFTDFIEGVRLVTGESKLVGLPSPWILSSDSMAAHPRFVLLLQAPA